MAEFYPRVLILSPDNLGDHSATAITLSNLFKDWPSESIAIVYGNIPPSESDICKTSWHLSLDDVPIDRFFRKLLGKRKEVVIGKLDSGIPGGVKVSSNNLKQSIFYALYEAAHSWASILSFEPPPSFWNWVKEFNPDMIYSVLGSNRYMDIALRLSKQSNVPIVPHFMDDWPSTYYHGILNIIPRSIMYIRLQRIIKRSSLGLTISDYMSFEYQKRYGIPFKAFMNCLNIPSELCLEPNLENTILKLVFVGGLHLNRWKSIFDFENTLTKLMEEDLFAELTIHAPQQDMELYSKYFAESKVIKIGKTLSQIEIYDVLRKADILIHVESFNHAIKQYTRLSLSTKIPQYMASGRPILFYGPKGIASYNYINDNRIGLVVDDESSDKLIMALRKFIQNKSLREKMGKRAREIALERHSAAIVRREFRSTLASVEENYRKDCN